MLFWQDEKDQLKQELATINRKLNELNMMQDYQQTLIDKLEEGISLVMGHPYGSKKDGTPKAKPGRKPHDKR